MIGCRKDPLFFKPSALIARGSLRSLSLHSDSLSPWILSWCQMGVSFQIGWKSSWQRQQMKHGLTEVLAHEYVE